MAEWLIERLSLRMQVFALAFLCLRCGGVPPGDGPAALADPIIGGYEVPADDSTWVSLRWPVGDGKYARCSGAVAANRSILSARHCFEAVEVMRNGQLVTVPFPGPSAVEVAMGSQLTRGSNIDVFSSFGSDLALLRVERAFSLYAMPTDDDRTRAGYQRPLWNGNPPEPTPLRCYGYGGAFPTPLKATVLEADGYADARHYVTTHMNEDGDIQTFGDSGGGCTISNETYEHWSPIVMIEHTCFGDICQGDAADHFRSWAIPLLSTCAHDVCDAGGPLQGSCDRCAALVCAQDSWCCTSWWDEQCVGEVQDFCGSSSSAPTSCAP